MDRSYRSTPLPKTELMSASFLVLACCFALLCSAQAQTYQTYYVAKTGSDSNSGSASAPWLTIGHAAAVAQAGSTVYVGAGTYNESVQFANSGTPSAPIVFNGQGVAIVDGTGVACCTTPSFATSTAFLCCSTQGLFEIGAAAGVGYLTIEGFTIQNYKTSSKTNVPLGILIAGSGSGINILNNTVQNIQTTAGKRGNAYAIGVFGISATPLSVTVSGNTVTGCLTGQSETTTFNGNVQDFVVSNNAIYNNDNIGIDAVGFEGVGPTGYDQAMNGDVYGNVIYNNSAYRNPGEGNQYDEDGLYCDGCTGVTFERNTLYGNDLNIEAASEIAGKVSSNVIIRNNLAYGANSAGISVGGYARSGTGGSANITIVNNSLYDNDTQKTGSGEFQIQYRATGILFENNIVYAGAQGLFMHGFVSGSGVTANYNDYYTSSSTTTFELNNKTYSSFASYQAATGQDQDSVFANPDYLTTPTCTSTRYSSPPTPITTCTPTPNFDIPTSSPAENTGNASLCSADFGTVDFNGNPRVNANGQINMGAFEQ
ncbi:MAG TPA: right-handed parallel beta-helix repeat-containing protein [Terriglobales bacterium]|nr:right-handed parallel beta-helix repeat-containing protein [Terriglobales bacterium]